MKCLGRALETPHHAGPRLLDHLPRAIEHEPVDGVPLAVVVDPRAKIAPFKTERAAADSPGRRILLVDDDEYIGAAVSLFLQRRGEDIVHCASAAAARRWLAAHRCDLVITDILMPDSDGLEFIQWFRSVDTRTKIIAISDRYGAIRNDRGIDLAALNKHLAGGPAGLTPMLRDLAAPPRVPSSGPAVLL